MYPKEKLETNFLPKHLDQSQSVLEAGCGNGFLTNIIRDKVKHVDAFDYAENMISRAKSEQGEKNNKFFHDNILSPRHWASQYDTIVCVRVLINLRNLDEQKLAVENMANSLHKGGKLILINLRNLDEQELAFLRFMDKNGVVLGVPIILLDQVSILSKGRKTNSN